MPAADYIVDIGPGAGVHGGEMWSAPGTVEDIMACTDSVTGQYLSGQEDEFPCPGAPDGKRQVAHHPGRPGEQSAKTSMSHIPLGAFTCGHRRVRLGQELAGQRDPLQDAGSRAQPAPRPARASIRRYRGHGAAGQGHRHRPVAHRTHPPFQPGDLHRRVHRHPGAFRHRPTTPRCGATTPGASPSMSRADGARPATATASSRSRCTSCRTSMSPARCARASATTGRPWRSNTRARISTMCWR